MTADVEIHPSHRPLDLDQKRDGHLDRAPLPRFNEKSLCHIGDGLAETGLKAAAGYRRIAEAVQRSCAVAEAKGVSGGVRRRRAHYHRSRRSPLCNTR